MEAERLMAHEVPLSRCGLSVRAINICRGLNCATIGELSDLFGRKGVKFVLGRPNCGRKTLSELLDLVQELQTHAASHSVASGPDGETGIIDVMEFTAERALNALEALQIPYGFPISFVKLPA